MSMNKTCIGLSAVETIEVGVIAMKRFLEFVSSSVVEESSYQDLECFLVFSIEPSTSASGVFEVVVSIEYLSVGTFMTSSNF
jgi:hypothetical protein